MLAVPVAFGRHGPHVGLAACPQLLPAMCAVFNVAIQPQRPGRFTAICCVGSDFLDFFRASMTSMFRMRVPRRADRQQAVLVLRTLLRAAAVPYLATLPGRHSPDTLLEFFVEEFTGAVKAVERGGPAHSNSPRACFLLELFDTAGVLPRLAALLGCRAMPQAPTAALQTPRAAQPAPTAAHAAAVPCNLCCGSFNFSAGSTPLLPMHPDGERVIIPSFYFKFEGHSAPWSTPHPCG